MTRLPGAVLRPCHRWMTLWMMTTMIAVLVLTFETPSVAANVVTEAAAAAAAATAEEVDEESAIEFLSRIQQESGVVEDESVGLLYKKVSNSKSGRKIPTDATVCSFHFTLSYSNGTKIHSTIDVEDQKPVTAAPIQTFPGFQESLFKMTEGDNMEFYLPPGYLHPGEPHGMDPTKALVLNIKLLEITNLVATMNGPNKEGAKFLKQQSFDPSVQKTPTGLLYKVLEDGWGEYPDIDRVCLFHYTISYTNGTVIKSTYYEEEEHLRAAPNEVVKEFRGSFMDMAVGSIWEFYVPPNVGFGGTVVAGQKVPPGTVLVYRFELVELTNERAELTGPSPEDVQYLTQKEMEAGVVKLKSGLLFKKIVEGTGDAPKFDSLCTIHYNSSLVNGTKLWNPEHQNEDEGPMIVSPNEVQFKGLREALMLMKEGSKWEIYIPPELGYGEKGLEGVIHEGAVMIYEMELLKVEEREQLQKGVTMDGIQLEGLEFLNNIREEEGVVELPSGLMYKVIKDGTGKKHPKIDTPCTINYLGTFVDETVFDSSYGRDMPVVLTPSQAIPGWTEALQLMTKGAKWKVYIPPNLGYGERGAAGVIPGGAVLVFTLTLVDVHFPETDIEAQEEL